jgi:hypothetical protein
LITQEVIHHGRPERDPPRKQRMAVFAMRREIDELGASAGAGEGGVHSARQFGPKEFVVLHCRRANRGYRRR